MQTAYSAVMFLLALQGGCQCLKNLKVYVPPAIRKGETAVFMCDFDLEDDQLYSVKWYKGRNEFYRYTPKEEDPIKTFSIDHVYVDKNKSNMTQLTLLRVTPPLSGVYNCEVSAEAPSFQTAIDFAEMTVVEIPSQAPSIHGLKKSYAAGEVLNATCIGGASKPPVNLTWFINNDKVNSEFVRNLVPLNGSGNLTHARSQITLIVKSVYFRNSGRLVVRCSGSIPHIYLQSAERIVEEYESLLEREDKVVVVVEEVGRDDSNRRKHNKHKLSKENGSSSALSELSTLLQFVLLFLGKAAT